MLKSCAYEPGPERDDEERHHRGQEHQDRGPGEHDRVGRGRGEVLLEEHLQAGDHRVRGAGGPTRSGPTREFMKAMTFSSM